MCSSADWDWEKEANLTAGAAISEGWVSAADGGEFLAILSSQRLFSRSVRVPQGVRRGAPPNSSKSSLGVQHLTAPHFLPLNLPSARALRTTSTRLLVLVLLHLDPHSSVHATVTVPQSSLYLDPSRDKEIEPQNKVLQPSPSAVRSGLVPVPGYQSYEIVQRFAREEEFCF